MKKLTAGIFATLMVVVSAGAARADIASDTYVNQMVGERELASNKETDATQVDAMQDAEKKVKFPTINVAEEIARKAVDGRLNDLGLSETGVQGFQTKSNIATGDDLTSINTDETRKTRYTSVDAAERISRDNIDGALSDAGFTRTPEGNITIPYERTANIVKNETEFDALINATGENAQANKESRYMSANATDQAINRRFNDISADLGDNYQQKHEVLDSLVTMTLTDCPAGMECALIYDSTQKAWRFEPVNRGAPNAGGDVGTVQNQ